nr:histidinol dehydrogenase-like [Nerophis lumbriciformis]
MRILRFDEAGYGSFLTGLNRRAVPGDEVRELVEGVLEDVVARGDEALRDLTEKFDGVKLDDFLVGEEELAEARAAVDEKTRAAVAASRKNIQDFAKSGMRQDWKQVNDQGVEVGERFDAFHRVGIYVPGGKAPLVSTALMTGAFAQAAGVKEIVAMTPPGAEGKVNTDLLYALQEAGATEIYKVGGAQAIGALAYGTETVKPVDKVFGPGNAFVVEAKRQVLGAVSIDLLPGPSEVLVIADESGEARFLAADLLAQAEHGPDSEVVFLTTSAELLKEVKLELDRQLAELPRREIARSSLKKKGFLLLVESMDEAVEIANDFAPEHLTLVASDEDEVAARIVSAGAIYLGNFSAVAVGDFLAGPSHTLPTGGGGRSFSGLRPDQFQRRTSVVRMSQEALDASCEMVEHFAEIEGLAGHGSSARIRQSQ